MQRRIFRVLVELRDATIASVRIVFSGTHRVGKSTLLALVADELETYETIAEPYELLEEEGYEHGDPPSLEDFEAQLERSIAALVDTDDEDVLFDRGPADLLAYLLTHEDGDAFDLDAHLDDVRAAMKTIDLVVFVPIEDEDRIALPAHEDPELRIAVHEKLREILLEDAFGFRRDIFVAEGDPETRARRVMKRVSKKRGTFAS